MSSFSIHDHIGRNNKWSKIPSNVLQTDNAYSIATASLFLNDYKISLLIPEIGFIPLREEAGVATPGVPASSVMSAVHLYSYTVLTNPLPPQKKKRSLFFFHISFLRIFYQIFISLDFSLRSSILNVFMFFFLSVETPKNGVQTFGRNDVIKRIFLYANESNVHIILDFNFPNLVWPLFNK